MKKIILGLSFVAMILSACAGSSKDPEQLDNALAGFAACVQSSRWQEALDYVTQDEAYAISPDGYEFKEEYKVAARRLPLSTLRKAGLELDRHGRLVGIKKAMDEANERYVMSEDQAKVGTNLKEMEDARIKRRIEEGQKILKGEEEEAKAEPEVEVFTNKLTDEEKRKYGSTRDLQAPEAYNEPDEDEERAKEEIHGDYETDY
ncbi:MAG: hypothetical protein IKR75_09870 [Fibrobacter sp.]|jgi:hypothetical protein|nr:hypothetical protein [Fibrobacter sp.]MBR6318709.1 hypothetical protein [Fibrobacter sp.]